MSPHEIFPRRPQKTHYFQWVQNHFKDLEMVWEERYYSKYGFFNRMSTSAFLPILPSEKSHRAHNATSSFLKVHDRVGYTKEGNFGHTPAGDPVTVLLTRDGWPSRQGDPASSFCAETNKNAANVKISMPNWAAWPCRTTDSVGTNGPYPLHRMNLWQPREGITCIPLNVSAPGGACLKAIFPWTKTRFPKRCCGMA